MGLKGAVEFSRSFPNIEVHWACETTLVQYLSISPPAFLRSFEASLIPAIAHSLRSLLFPCLIPPPSQSIVDKVVLLSASPNRLPEKCLGYCS